MLVLPTFSKQHPMLPQLYLSSSTTQSWLQVMNKLPNAIAFLIPSFDDSDAYLANNKQTGRVRGVPDNNLMKSFAADKDKASNVAKIKVVILGTSSNCLGQREMVSSSISALVFVCWIRHLKLETSNFRHSIRGLIPKGKNQDNSRVESKRKVNKESSLYLRSWPFTAGGSKLPGSTVKDAPLDPRPLIRMPSG